MKSIFKIFQHERIHACMGESVLKYFDKIFHEGHAYVIRNFRVKYYESSEINRCFKNEQHIVLSCLTRAYRVKENICNIPSNVWKFADLGKLNEFDENINHFIGEFIYISCFCKFLQIRIISQIF